MTSALAIRGYDLYNPALPFKNYRTYLIALLFVLGNIAFPAAVHAIPNGGRMFLPIFFFTLISAYKFGWKTGVLTAIASPVANYLLTGMPMPAMLIDVVGKSLLIVLAVVLVTSKMRKLSIVSVLATVLLAQVFGAALSFALGNNVSHVYNSVVFSAPGLLIQVVLGYILLVVLKDYGYKKS
jgi:hypothetical protein